MPELVDLEVAKENMYRRLKNKRLVGISFPVPAVLRNCDPSDAERCLKGKHLTTIGRVSKVLHFTFEESSVAIHLMLHGDYCWRYPKKKEKNVVCSMDFGDDAILIKDWSRWTKIELDCPHAGIHSQMLSMDYGIDPLSGECSAAAIAEVLEKKRRSGIKKVLMDQSLIAGIGNAYSDEILWTAGIHPSRQCGNVLQCGEEKELADAVRTVLTESMAIVRVLSEGHDISEQERDFMHVYRRSGQKCPRCGYMIVCLKIIGRDTFVCEKCQPRKRIN